MKKMKKTVSLFLVFVLISGISVNAASFIDTNVTLDFDKVNSGSIIFTPDKYLGLDLYEKNFDRNLMTVLEEEYFDYLLEEATEGNREDMRVVEELLTSNDAMEFINNKAIFSTRNVRSSTPWWHLNSVKNVGNAIDIVISAALGGLGASSVRALIQKMGENQAKKMIKSNIIMKVKSTLIRWGMHQGANIVEKFGVSWIMKAIDYSPGYQIAKLIDSKDKRPNNGYIEFW